jgi:glycerol-1-phosphate dehydrogenase [NAD(P)+]
LNAIETSIDQRLESKAEIELPRLIDVKMHAIENIAIDCEKLLLKDTCSLIVDELTYDIAGKKVEDILKSAKIDVHVLKIEGATMEAVDIACELYKEVNAQFSVAVGGGTVIDVAKYSSFKENIPFVSVPTVASHDGISSARASIKTENRSFSYEARPPTLVIGDVETMSKAPKRFAISGACDLLSNRTAVLDWYLSQRITGEHVSEYASALANLTADSMINSRNEIALDPILRTYTVFKGLISSSMAMCIAGSSRPASGAEHLISHRLDKLMKNPAMHGEQCGLMSVFTM